MAGRWKHRISTDIDVLLPGRNTLIELLQDNDRNIVSQLPAFRQPSLPPA